MNVVIRPCEKNDLAAVHQLVLDLAIYEKAEEQLKLTVDDYHEHFDDDVFKCIVAEYQGRIIGTCIYYMTFSTWKSKMLYLEDFVVSPDFRGSGVGQQLWDEYISIAKREKCALVKWQVLDWNEPAIRFYERNGATIEKEWWNGKIIF